MPSYGDISCTESTSETWWTRPDVVIPDGTTLQEPSTSKKYIKVDEVVELLVRAASSACNSSTYATDIAIPTVSDYEDFTMPTKPDITTLKVKATDKL